MIKKEIYPKTARIPVGGMQIHLTEKLDGSNLVFFKKNDVLYIAQRKNIFALSEIEENKVKLYPGLYNWLTERVLDNNSIDNRVYCRGEELENSLNNNSAICGEWIGMGQIKYPDIITNNRWFMFAKANVDDEFNLYNIKYDTNLFIYPFINRELPMFIHTVPHVKDVNYIPTKEQLDEIYKEYVNIVNRPVEGFVINILNNVVKYVRMKNGKTVEYRDTDHKGE